MNILDCRDSWATPIVCERIFDWRDFVPLAKAEASKFYWEQERGRFKYEELLSVAVEALATSKGVNHAIKAINGALLDFARDDHKLVRNIEMTEEEFHRTRSALPQSSTRPAAELRRVYILDGVRHVLYTPGPYRTNAQLLAGDGKPISKHGKVPVAIGRATYDDEWNQVIGGQVGARLDRDFQDVDEDGRPGEGLKLKRHRPEESGYTGAGTAKCWSRACISGGVVYKSGLTPEGWQGFKLPKRYGKASSNFRPTSNAHCRRTADPSPELAPSGQRTSNVKVDMSKFGLAPQNQPAKAAEARAIAALLAPEAPPAAEQSPAMRAEAARLALSRELPKFPSILWHREAGSVDMDKAPWGLPDFGIFCRDADMPNFGPKKHPWRRGKNIFASVHNFSGLGRSYNRGDDPSRLAHGPAVRGGSRADRATPLFN
jgi:hypothetical protein